MNIINKLSSYNDLRLKLLSLSTASVILVNNAGLYPSDDKLDKFNDLFKRIKSTHEENIVDSSFNLDNYSITDEITVGGKTILFVSENEDVEVSGGTPVLTEEELMMYEDGWAHDDYVPTFNENLDFTSTFEMISFYSKVFELNYSVVSPIVNEQIEDDNLLDNEEYDSVEEAISRIMCNISSHPEDYDLTEEDIRSTDGYELDYYLPEELIYKFGTVLGVNPNLALAIAYCESGRDLDSSNFLNNNNVGGIVGSNGYVHYRNRATGLYRFILMLADNYNVTMESGSNKIHSMASTYCGVPDHWISVVGGIFYELETYGYDYSYNTYSYQNRDLNLCTPVSIEDNARVRN